MYAPETGKRNPEVIFSHGIGEDRDSYEYFGRALAQRGYLTVHITHAETDRAVLKSGYWKLYQATKKKESWINRPLDVSFVIDQLARRSDADLDRVAVAGHSAGAFSAFAVAGLRLGEGESFRDPRVKAIVAMSMPRLGGVVAPGGYADVKVPALNITGNCDSSLIYRTKPADRRVPFEESKARNQYLVTIEDVNHNTFSNRRDRHHDLIAEITGTFLDAYLRDDAAARARLDRGGFSTRERVALEQK
jgi:predicted dienelactone hydrolase